MKVKFGEIPVEGLRFEINDESWFPDQEIKRFGPVHATIFLKRNGVDRVLLKGRIQATVILGCDRCLESYNMEIDDEFNLDLEYASESKLESAEHEISVSEMDMIYLNEPAADLFEILNQQIFLLIPGKHLCAETCKGLCPQCGVNRNLETCSCKQDFSSSPFAVLKER
jgi:DUF177 domain-containing protein